MFKHSRIFILNLIEVTIVIKAVLKPPQDLSNKTVKLHHSSDFPHLNEIEGEGTSEGRKPALPHLLFIFPSP